MARADADIAIARPLALKGPGPILTDREIGLLDRIRPGWGGGAAQEGSFPFI
jgi:hypothetical protein